MMIDQLFHATIILFIIIVILPPYMEIYKVFNLYLGINFEILRFVGSTISDSPQTKISWIMMFIEDKQFHSHVCHTYKNT